MPHFVITVCEQEGPLAGDTQDSKTSALLRTIICTAIWSTISFMRDYLTIPCYLHGTQGFTAQRLSCTPEEQDLRADMGSTASTGGERGSQGTKNHRIYKIQPDCKSWALLCYVQTAQQFYREIFCCSEGFDIPRAWGNGCGWRWVFCHHICKWAPSQLAGSSEGDARLKSLANKYFWVPCTHLSRLAPCSLLHQAHREKNKVSWVRDGATGQ